LRIKWTDGASRNLDHIRDYIAQDSPQAADQMVVKIIESVEQLLQFPNMGRAGRIVETREWIITGSPYIVVYTVIQNTIYIIRIFHGALKWSENH